MSEYDLNDFQEDAATFRTESADHWYALLNLGSEVGELQGLVAKGIRDGFKTDYLEDFKKEMGDVLWCLSAVADDHQVNLQEIAELNIKKLADRKKRDVIEGSGDNR